METQTVFETYKRYLETFKDKNADLFGNYGKITNFIDTNCEGDDLRYLLSMHCIGRNLDEIRKRNIKIKDYSTDGWSTVVTSNGYQLLRKIKEAEREGDMNAYKLNLHRFYTLAENQAPHLQLYLYLCYSDRIDERLFKVSMDEIEAEAKKDIEAESQTRAQEQT